MPALRSYKCNHCDFKLYSGWGGHVYVEDDNGKRVVCGHPNEDRIIEEVLNLEPGLLVKMKFHKPSLFWSKKRRNQYNEIKNLVIERTGFNSICFCPACKNNFHLDLGERGAFFSNKNESSIAQQKDKKQCPECGSKGIKPVHEYIGETCPNCGQGEIEEINSGIIS